MPPGTLTSPDCSDSCLDADRCMPEAQEVGPSCVPAPSGLDDNGTLSVHHIRMPLLPASPTSLYETG